MCHWSTMYHKNKGRWFEPQCCIFCIFLIGLLVKASFSFDIIVYTSCLVWYIIEICFIKLYQNLSYRGSNLERSRTFEEPVHVISWLDEPVGTALWFELIKTQLMKSPLYFGKGNRKCILWVETCWLLKHGWYTASVCTHCFEPITVQSKWRSIIQF